MFIWTRDERCKDADRTTTGAGTSAATTRAHAAHAAHAAGAAHILQTLGQVLRLHKSNLRRYTTAIPMLQQTEGSPCGLAKFTLEELDSLGEQFEKLKVEIGLP
jgi:hypothetical protein